MRKPLRAGGVVLVLGVLVLVGRSWSDTRPAAPRTRVALINLAQVLKQYKKVSDLQEEVKGLLASFQEKAKKIQQQIEAHTKELQQTDLAADKRRVDEKTCVRLHLGNPRAAVL